MTSRPLIPPLFARLRALGADCAGNVLVFAAMGVLVIVAIVGGAVDLGFTYKAQNRLQGACDAAILAGRRAVTTNGYDATAQATAYFNANFVPAQQGTKSTSFTSASSDNGVTITGTAQTTVPLKIMPVFGRNTITVNTTCSATMGISNTDVTFVLDNTGSMLQTPSGFSSSKMVTLQAAMKSF